MRALITAPLSADSLEELRSEGVEVDYECWLETGKLHLGDSLLSVLKDGKYDIVIVEGDEIKEEVIENSDLKLIGSVRGNPNNISVSAATAKKIPVISVPGRNTNSVAELTVALILAQARNITSAERLLKSEFFVDDFKDFGKMYNQLTGFELKGRTVGIIGLGQIGYEVAKRLHAFDVDILITDPYADQNKVNAVDGSVVELDKLLKQSDVVTVHCAPTDETRGMLGTRQFELMKETAVFINTARASITDEYALMDALKTGKIAGAGLDVFSMEPVDSDNEFLELDNVTVMPHMGGNTKETILRQSTVIVANIKAFLNSEKLTHILNPEVLE
ncbi:MAG: NAD(P)-dependent oxidoreductase [Candidatus Thorarchaeota archaeon]